MTAQEYKDKLKAKVEGLSDPNQAVRVARGHLLRRIGSTTFIKRPHQPFWQHYKGDYGYAPPYTVRSVLLPLAHGQKILESRLGGSMRFRYSQRHPLYVEQLLDHTTVKCSLFRLELQPKPTRNIELALRAVISRLEWLLGASGQYQPSNKMETNDE